MSAAVLTQPTYQRTPDCPSWCQQHEWEDVETGQPVLAAHLAPLSRGDVSVALEWWPNDNSPSGTSEPFVGMTPEYVWLSGQSVRDYAALLNEAADILGRAS